MKGKGMVGLGRIVISKRERIRKEDEYFANIPNVKISGEMLKLAEHILETKAAEFDPSEFVDHYEVAVVDLLKKKQGGKAPPKAAKRAPAVPVSNVIDLLKRSVELEAKRWKKSKSPPLAPEMLKGKKKQRA